MFNTSHLFFFGDLNFRLALPSTHALSAPDQLANLAQALSGDDGRSELKEYDQLVIERDVKGTIFHGFREGEFWRFKCSYKYRLGEVDHYEYVPLRLCHRDEAEHDIFTAPNACRHGQTGSCTLPIQTRRTHHSIPM